MNRAWQSAENQSESLSHKSHVCFEKNGPKLACFCTSFFIFIGDIADGFCEGHLPIASLGLHEKLVWQIAFSPLLILSSLWVKAS